MSQEPVLSVQDMHAGYGPIRALRGVSFEVHEAQTVSIIGANGVGKTSLMRAVSGLISITQGTATFMGQDIRKSAPHRLANLGMLHVPEGRGTLQTMSVEENLRLAWEIRPTTVSFEEGLAKVYDSFERLRERRAQLAGNLSGGEQQMLALARAIINRPRLLLLDEPSMGLSPRLTAEVFKVLRQLRDSGVSILLVEQNVSSALELAHRAMVLSQGKFVLEGNAADLLHDPRVMVTYMGH
jgi:branched-chain amino acid transport system ATP-binding protein